MVEMNSGGGLFTSWWHREERKKEQESRSASIQLCSFSLSEQYSMSHERNSK
jgi:hypothetical protein